MELGTKVETVLVDVWKPYLSGLMNLNLGISEVKWRGYAVKNMGKFVQGWHVTRFCPKAYWARDFVWEERETFWIDMSDDREVHAVTEAIGGPFFQMSGCDEL